MISYISKNHYYCLFVLENTLESDRKQYKKPTMYKAGQSMLCLVTTPLSGIPASEGKSNNHERPCGAGAETLVGDG